MSILKSAETLGKLIPIAQILIVLLTVFTIWASIQKGRLEKIEKDKLAKQITETKSELEKSTFELKEIKKRTSPRTLTSEQAKLLEKELSFPSKFSIQLVCRMTDTEGLNYAQEIAHVFQKAGWIVGPVNRTFIDDISSDITMATTSEDQDSEASRIAEIFNKAGMNCEPEKIRENSISITATNCIVIIIGSKK